MEHPNWFTAYADEWFTRHLMPLAGSAGLRFLQIGAYTGDASLWLLDNVLTGPGARLMDVDTWRGSNEPEHEAMDWHGVRATYLERVAPYRPERLMFWPNTSASFWQFNLERFDFIYLDGDHTAPAVLADAVHAFDALRVGGLLAFDDYQWKPYPDAPAQLAPGIAIDTFTACYQDHLQIIEAGLQVWVRKTR